MDRNLSPALGQYFRFILLHDLGHEISHGFCGLVLDLVCGVGVGAKGKACIVVAQHTADGFHVNAVLKGDRGKGVAQGVQSGKWATNWLTGAYTAVWVVGRDLAVSISSFRSWRWWYKSIASWMGRMV